MAEAITALALLVFAILSQSWDTPQWLRTTLLVVAIICALSAIAHQVTRLVIAAKTRRTGYRREVRG